MATNSSFDVSILIDSRFREAFAALDRPDWCRIIVTCEGIDAVPAPRTEDDFASAAARLLGSRFGICTLAGGSRLPRAAGEIEKAELLVEADNIAGMLSDTVRPGKTKSARQWHLADCLPDV